MSMRELLADLRASTPLIGPSLLACDFANLESEIRRVEEAGAKILHLDIMDGHFVPNISFGLPVVEAVRRTTALALDVHLMISDPVRYAPLFRDAGADLITFHIETTDQPRELLEQIRAIGAGAGITLNPPTPVAAIESCLDLCDLVLVMSVMPGFGGQQFDPVAMKKLRRLRTLAGPELLLSVDGGINPETIGDCAAAGADLFVTGTALFAEDNYTDRIAQLTGLVTSTKDVRA